MLRKIFLSLIGLTVVLGCTLISQANPSLTLGLPIACTLGQDCFILLYPDRDPGNGAVDFGCGRMTYDGHTGTDFAIPDQRAMNKGVPVKAVAAGKVLRIRDEVPDRRLENSIQQEEVRGFECGNGVVIDHGKGWETQYCHLLMGSVVAKPGDLVTNNTVLGKVGMSGMASFPHVHLSVRYQGKVVDPFVGLEEESSCPKKRQPLWEMPLSYVPTGLIRAGFAQQPPELDDVWAGNLYEQTLPATLPALVFWVQAYGVLPGDVEQFEVIAPDGQVVVNQRRQLQAPNRVWLSYVGKRANSQPLTPGRWQGKYKLTRGDRVLIDRQQQVLLQ
jgi:murein DD-endopeptidase MepM/ murein hydrolase activator NlpD